MTKVYRYVAYKLRTTCDNCGSPIMVGGISRRILCHNCFYRMVIEDTEWPNILQHLEEEYPDRFRSGGTYSGTLSSGHTFRYHETWKNPVCDHCKAPLNFDNFHATESGKINCGKCGKSTSVYPFPTWLRTLMPTGSLLIGTENPEELDSEKQMIEEDKKPVLMNCPQCGSNISISVANERVTECDFCSSEFFIPDAIWQRIHPVRTVKEWYIRFEGKSLFDRKIEARKEKEQRRIDEQKKREELKYTDYMNYQKKSGKVTLFTAISGFFSTILLLAALSGISDALILPLLVIFSICFLVFFVSFILGMMEHKTAINMVDHHWGFEWVIVFFPAMFPFVGIIFSIVNALSWRSLISRDGVPVSRYFARHIIIGYLFYHTMLTGLFVSQMIKVDPIDTGINHIEFNEGK